ncbi:MAG: PAS domain-containing protein [Acidobacteria bacterium]|nr:PAS domain-containing protein [Acidobacteriota bacterium]
MAFTIIVVVLLSVISLVLSLYSESLRGKSELHQQQYKIQAALLAALLAQTPETSSTLLRDFLQANHIVAQAALLSANGETIASASTTTKLIDFATLQLNTDDRSTMKEIAGASPTVAYEVKLQTRQQFHIAELPIKKEARQLVLAFPVESDSPSLTYYIFSYQVVALIIGLLFIYFLIRWLMRPYRRLVEAAQDSPVRASAAQSESEFVVETFQALIQQLQSKEAELAHLHELARRRAEKSERFSERLVANIPSGLVAVNSKGHINAANRYALQLFNFPGATASLENSQDFAEPNHPSNYEAYFLAAPALIDMISQCLKTGIAFKREEVEIAQADAPARRLGLSVSPIFDSQHQVEGALCMMTDITEVTELRERIKLQETLANLGEMAAGLAHEFKNSLATIQGYVQLFDFQSDAATPTVQKRQTLDSMLKEVELLARLVTDFLNFARPQSLNFSYVNLRALLEDCVLELQPLLEKHEVALALTGDFITLACDESLLRRVFLNLIRNAIEAIDADAPVKQIEILGSTDKGTGKPYAHIRVFDTGSGISKEDLQNIFIPFFTTKSRGYGIGLAIVQKIIVAHGGSVAVERSDASGTVFHCRLPVAPYPLSVKK